MTSHRSRFLASLSERLQGDLAAREQDRDDSTPPWPETAGRTGGYEPRPEIAGDKDAGPPTLRAAQVEAEEDAPSETVTPSGAIAPIDALLRSERELSPPPSVPWSEAGMPVRLREAIDSVRRVSHEMHEPPIDDYATHGRAPFGGDADYNVYPLNDDAAYEEPPHDRTARVEHDAGPEDEQLGPRRHVAYEEPLPYGELALLDGRARFQHERPPLDDDAEHEESQAAEELVLRGDGALGDDGRTRVGVHAAYEEAPADDAPIPLDDPAYQRETITLDDDAALGEEGLVDEGCHAPFGLREGAGQTSAPDDREDSDGRRPLWRRATTRYGLHAAAFAVAIAFVALAGFGLGVLSGDGEEVGGPLRRDAVRAAARTEPGPPSTEQGTAPAELEQPTELSELVTVRVAPAPGVAVPEPALPARLALSAPPLPPPAKPAFRASATSEAAPAATGEAAPGDRQLAGLVEDAAAALLEAQEDAESADGAGGPFQPLFTKLPAARLADIRVFVHYSAGAVGAPATAMHLVRHLKAEGFMVEARPVEFSIPTNSIRYFFDADREQAEALRSRLEGQVPGGAALTVMDFTSYEPRPRPGLIEVWLRA